ATDGRQVAGLQPGRERGGYGWRCDCRVPEAALRKTPPEVDFVGPREPSAVGLDDCVARLSERRNSRRELHAIGHHLEHPVVARRASKPGDHVCPRLPEHQGPDLADIVDLAGTVHGGDRADNWAGGVGSVTDIEL